MAKKAIQEFNGLVKAQSLEIVDEIAANDVIANEVSNANLVFSLSSTQDYYYVSSTLAIKGKVIIPDYYKGLPVRSIYANGFINRTNIEYVKLPKYLLQISGSAFYGCTKLKEIEIPETVTEVGAYAFYNCTALEKVTVHASMPPTLGTSAFVNTPNTCKLSVPPASLVAYKGANWGDVNYGLLQANFLAIQFDGNAQTATKAEADENGDNIVNTYAKKNGTYPLMNVGGATNATNATKTAFTNESWTTLTPNGSNIYTTPTDGDYQVIVDGSFTIAQLSATLDFGVCHLSQTAASQKGMSFILGSGADTAKCEAVLIIDNNGTFSVSYWSGSSSISTAGGTCRIRRIK